MLEMQFMLEIFPWRSCDIIIYAETSQHKITGGDTYGKGALFLMGKTGDWGCVSSENGDPSAHQGFTRTDIRTQKKRTPLNWNSAANNHRPITLDREWRHDGWPNMPPLDGPPRARITHGGGSRRMRRRHGTGPNRRSNTIAIYCGLPFDTTADIATAFVNRVSQVRLF